MNYRTVVADPPWPYRDRGSFGRWRNLDGSLNLKAGSAIRYGEMAIPDLEGLDLPDLNDDAHLYLWTTNRFIVEAHAIARAWGFEPKTVLTWLKTHQDDRTQVSARSGYYFRGATEHCVFAVRGSLRLSTADVLPTGYLWPRLPHSVKPDAFYDLVESASPPPRLELFARRARFGWEYAGDESLGTVVLDGLA